MLAHLAAGGLCLLLLPASTDGVRLVQRAEAGTKLVRTYRLGGEIRMTEFSVLAAGEEHAPDDLPELLIRGESRFVVRDELLDVRAGEARRVQRTYEMLEDVRSFAGPGGDARSEREGVLEGETVVFERDAESGSWVASAKSPALDAELLEGLRADLSLASFLPPGEVEEGATWRLSSAEAAMLLRPLGELDLRSEEEAHNEDSRQFSRSLQDSLTGTVEATYRGTRTENGQELAVIGLEIEARLGTSLEVPGEGLQEVRIEREFEGELLWHVEAGRLHSVELEGRTSETTTQVRQLATPEGEVEVRQRQVFEGDRTLRIEVTEG